MCICTVLVNLRAQSINLPCGIAGGLSSITESIVNSVWTTLPELPFDRLDSQATPVRGAWDLVDSFEFSVKLLDAIFQDVSVCDWGRLWRSPGADSGVTRPSVEVDLRLLIGQELGGPVHTNLALQLGPEEVEGSLGV